MDEPSTESLDAASILLVDDLEANLVALEGVLAPLGQRLVRARSGFEALGAVLREDFACILMDVQMPGMDGLEAASLIKKRDRSKGVPILFMTAFSRSETEIARAYAEGAVDFIVKPFNADQLRTKVAVFVDLWQQSRTLLAREHLLRDRERMVMALEAAERIRPFVAQAKSEAHSLRRTLSYAVDAAPIELGILNADLRYDRINSRLAALHGQSVRELSGSWLKLVCPQLFDAVADALETSGGNKPVVVAETIESPTGEQRTLMVTFDPTIPDGPAGLVLDVTSATPRARARLSDNE